MLRYTIYNEKMKILNIITSTNPKNGGTIEWINQFSEICKQLGHSSEILSLDSPEDSWVKNTPIQTYAVGACCKYFYSRSLVPWLTENADNYEHIIIHGLWRYTSFGSWRALAKLSIPYFIYTHGMLDPWFKDNYPLKHLGKWLYWPWTDYRVLRDAKSVIYTCEEEKEQAHKSFWLYKAKEIVASLGIAPPPVDEESVESEFYLKYPRLRGKKNILFLGRVHEKKGCDLLLKAFSEILKISPEYHLVMAGPCPDTTKENLNTIIKQHNISQHVTWTGMINGNLKWSAFRSADAFILPSHQENFGFSVVESLSCSTPVLISNKVNIWRELEESGSAIVSEDTLEGTIKILTEWAMLNEEQKAKMGQRAFSCFTKNYEAKQAVINLINKLQSGK